ncbi:class I SAM-dependent methyltransferase [Chloroflexota bacterium]
MIFSEDLQKGGTGFREVFNTQQDVNTHFSRVAISYNHLRITDLEPIAFIKGILNGKHSTDAADIGCGAGRYCLKFLQHLDIRHLMCIDVNESMLEQTANYLRTAGITNFNTLRSRAEDIPLEDNSIDYIFCFNAIHHFDFVPFMEKTAKVVRDRGRIFIYTRLRSQNAENIWGKHFPLFLEKENRLYELKELEGMIKPTESLSIEYVKQFKYRRNASLSQLAHLARNNHYSTFSLYQKHEFEVALKGFKENITRHFSTPEEIEWFDEYTLLVVRKENGVNP